jgi:hypothetical protein
MSNDPKLDEAIKLLKAFDDQLTALNDGKRLNQTWQKKLLAELKRQWPGKAGKLPDYGIIQRVVAELSLVDDELRAPRTKHHNPADYKKSIESKLGVNRKRVDRIARKLPVLLNELEPMLNSLPEAERKAYINGMSEAISRGVSAEIAAEDAAEQAERERKYQELIAEAAAAEGSNSNSAKD